MTSSCSLVPSQKISIAAGLSGIVGPTQYTRKGGRFLGGQPCDYCCLQECLAHANAISAIAAIQDCLPPMGVLTVPADRPGEARLESFVSPPSQFSFDFGGINRIPTIVAGAVLNKGDQAPARTPSVGSYLIEKIANAFHDE